MRHAVTLPLTLAAAMTAAASTLRDGVVAAMSAPPPTLSADADLYGEAVQAAQSGRSADAFHACRRALAAGLSELARLRRDVDLAALQRDAR